MIKAIVFDLDGVIYFSDKLWSDEFSEKYGIPNHQLKEFFKDEFKKCIVGKLDTREELQKYKVKWDWQHEVDQIFEHWFNYGQIDNDMITLIKQLKQKGIICILCTNNEKYRINHFREKYGFNELFDYIFASYDVGHKKPYPEIFEKITKTVQLNQTEMLFVDDDKENIKGAKDFGFNVYIYKELDAFQEKLDELL